MERMKVRVTIPPEVSEFEKKQKTLLLKSPFIKDYLALHHMTHQDVEENLPFFLQLVDEIKECKACSGLAHCVKKEIGYVPTLKKIGFVQWVKTPCRYQKEAVALKEKLQRYRYKQLSPLQRDITFSTIDLHKESKEYQEVFAQVVKWANFPEDKGFYLFGHPGVGKSYLMLCLINQLVDQKRSVAFVNVLELISQNKQRIDFDVLDEIIDADFVVLDDIGAEAVTVLSRDDVLFAILDARMNLKKSTCFTSNFNMVDLEAHFVKNQYGDVEPVKAMRIMERIRALAVEVEMYGKSRR